MSDSNKDQQQTYLAWAEFTLQRLRAKLYQLKVDRTFKLNRSLKSVVYTLPGGATSKIEFSFLYYGRFVDMGVGKGMPLGATPEARKSRNEIGRTTGNRRVPKVWYSKVFFTEAAKLKHIIAHKYGIEAVDTIIEGVTNDFSNFNNP